MTLRTITFDDSTHKIVPIEANEIQIQQGCLSYNDGFITFTEFDTTSEEAYLVARQAIAECSKQDEAKMVILSFTMIGKGQ